METVSGRRVSFSGFNFSTKYRLSRPDRVSACATAVFSTASATGSTASCATTDEEKNAATAHKDKK